MWALAWLLFACSDPAPVARPSLPSVDGWDREAQIVAGYEQTCVVLRDGGVACWGHGYTGGLGNGRLADQSTPVRLPDLENVVELSMHGHACALRSDGSSACWGFEVPTGLVGSGSHALATAPIEQPFSPVLAIDAGPNSVCGLFPNGVVQCRAPADAPPIAFPIFDAVGAERDRATVCLTSATGPVSCFELPTVGTGDPMPIASAVPIVELEGGFALGLDGRVRSSAGAVVDGAERIVKLARTSYRHVCAIHDDGGVSCWGQNDRGQLGRPSSSNGALAMRVAGVERAVDVAAGETHTCALLATGRVLCWGANDRGQLGDGTNIDSVVPVEVVGLDLTAETEVTAVPAAEGACLERDSDGDGMGDRDETRARAFQCLYEPPAADDDLVPNALDLDSDDDGLPDEIEHAGSPCDPRQHECDEDTVPSFLDPDSDDDGVRDEDEVDAAAACAPDRDGDAFLDIGEQLGLSPSPNLAIDLLPMLEGHESSVSIDVDASGASTTVTLVPGEIEHVRGPDSWPPTLEIHAVDSTSASATTRGAAFDDVAPGTRVRFSLSYYINGGAFEGDTIVFRTPLTLVDGEGLERGRGELVTVVQPLEYCPGD